MSKRIFSKEISIEQINTIGQGCLIEHLDIQITEIGADYITASMPVDHRTKQPMGLLHGGASVALAESLGSYASVLLINLTKESAVGLEINANHVRSATSGHVYGKVTPIHIGRKTHVWNIEIKNDEEKLVSVSRITIAIIPHK